mmetsp:Transcript_40391/g.67685  ORF Transcript_40391/g.67685 Transcript_40391/m.67685 type:complete len:109 (-) Transcript_40391:657-983(-)
MTSKHTQIANEKLWARPEFPLHVSHLEGLKQEVEKNDKDVIFRLNGAGEDSILLSRKSSYQMLHKVKDLRGGGSIEGLDAMKSYATSIAGRDYWVDHLVREGRGSHRW